MKGMILACCGLFCCIFQAGSIAVFQMEQHETRKEEDARSGDSNVVRDGNEVQKPSFGPRARITALEFGKIWDRNMEIISQRTGDDLGALQRNVYCPFENPQCPLSQKLRNFDGTCNNLKNPLFGVANVPFRRLLPPSYDDRFNKPRTRDRAGGKLPSARLISTTVLPPSNKKTITNRLNHFGVAFGQFVAHDCERVLQHPANIDCCASRDAGKCADDDYCFPIEVPADDRFFSSFNRTCMNFLRSIPAPQTNCSTGARQQINGVTGFLDASNVYGSSIEEADFLRLKRGGLMRTTECGSDHLPPPDEKKKSVCSQAKLSPEFSCFTAGDFRVNENPGLTVHHVLWLREHNRIARRLARARPSWTDERLFQETRRIVIAEMQQVVYSEFLPAVLGVAAGATYDLRPRREGYFDGYDDGLDASPANGFSAAAFRFGHSMVDDAIPMVAGCFDLYRKCAVAGSRKSSDGGGPLLPPAGEAPPGGRLCPENELSVPLREVFERPDTLYGPVTGVDATLRGLLLANAQQLDHLVAGELKDHLFEFGSPGQGLDLAAINIQRGRDHGIPAYNEWREFCGLSRVVRWGVHRGGLVDHTWKVARLLKTAYRHPDDIDLFAGGVSEKPLGDSLAGPTFTCILGMQFRNIRLGDRFWFENRSPNPFTPEQLRSIRDVKYSRIIADNSGLPKVPKDAFRPIDATSNFLVDRFLLPSLNLSLWLET